MGDGVNIEVMFMMPIYSRSATCKVKPFKIKTDLMAPLYIAVYYSWVMHWVAHIIQCFRPKNKFWSWGVYWCVGHMTSLL